MKINFNRLALILAAFYLYPQPAPLFAIDSQKMASADVIGLDFKDLANIQVTSVSKKEDRLMQTAAAIYIISGDDIRRSGATTLAEALRLAPGLDVARTNSNTWAISARGFNSTAANKLLVMIDDRIVYSPLFSGVFWDVQDVLFDNIDRIEVILGPGAAVWGSNAVNGVIDIIRKPAAETQGGRVTVGLGTEDSGMTSGRYGGQFSDNGYYRVSGKYFKKDNTELRDHSNANDAWWLGNGSVRMDWAPSEEDSYTFSSDLYSGVEGNTTPINTLTPPFRVLKDDETDVNGGNARGVWTRRFSEKSNFKLLAYYDRTSRNIHPLFGEARDTYDVEMQNTFPLSSSQNFIWGLGFRDTYDHVTDAFGLNFATDEATLHIYDYFFQDEISFRHFLFALGSKIEYHGYSGLEIQPNARASWIINNRNTLWTSVSRAVRTPTRFDREIRVSAVVSTAPLADISFRGQTDYAAEDLVAYELGYRSKLSSEFFFEGSSFYNVYNNLLSIEPGTPFPSATVSPHTVIPYNFDNQTRAESYGFELAPQWQPTEWWRIQPQYSYLHLRLHSKPGSLDTQTVATEGNNPEHQVALRMAFNLPQHFEFDTAVRYVDNLPNLHVNSYTTADARVGWRGIRQVNLELIGQNLFQPRHAEFAPGNYIERGVFGRATWNFR